MGSPSYYVYSQDTGTGVQYFTSTDPSLSTTGVRVGGPFTQAQAQAFINGGQAVNALGNIISGQSQWWVGGLVEAGAGTNNSSGQTPYMPFVFKANGYPAAEANAGAKLLAGPFGTQAKAQDWADSYEQNPATVHAGSGLSPSTGTVQGDAPPAALGSFTSTAAAIKNVLKILADVTMWRSLAWLVLGVILMISGIALWLKRSAGELVAGAMFPEVA